MLAQDPAVFLQGLEQLSHYVGKFSLQKSRTQGLALVLMDSEHPSDSLVSELLDVEERGAVGMGEQLEPLECGEEGGPLEGGRRVRDDEAGRVGQEARLCALQQRGMR